MITSLHRIAEKKIEQAVKDGLDKKLGHWKNKPLPPDPFRNVPDDRRMAYRILKNAGYVPEEISIQREINQIEDFLRDCVDEKERVRNLKKIDFLRFKMERQTGKKFNLSPDSPYYERVVDRVAVGRKPGSK